MTDGVGHRATWRVPAAHRDPDRCREIGRIQPCCPMELRYRLFVIAAPVGALARHKGLIRRVVGGLGTRGSEVAQAGVEKPREAHRYPLTQCFERQFAPGERPAHRLERLEHPAGAHLEDGAWKTRLSPDWS